MNLKSSLNKVAIRYTFVVYISYILDGVRVNIKVTLDPVHQFTLVALQTR